MLFSVVLESTSFRDVIKVQCNFVFLGRNHWTALEITHSFLPFFWHGSYYQGTSHANKRNLYYNNGTIFDCAFRTNTISNKVDYFFWKCLSKYEEQKRYWNSRGKPVGCLASIVVETVMIIIGMLPCSDEKSPITPLTKTVLSGVRISVSGIIRSRYDRAQSGRGWFTREYYNNIATATTVIIITIIRRIAVRVLLWAHAANRAPVCSAGSKRPFW